jgi:hypothetical protein
MTSDGTTTWTTGVVYSVAVKLSARGQYLYRLTATDSAGGAASLPASAPGNGPIVDSVPVLSYPGTAGYTADGVNPDTLASGATAHFQVKYTHPDGGPPTAVVLHVWGPSGAEIAGSPFLMTLMTALPNYKTGVLFAQNVPLTAVGVYFYQFGADDGFRSVTLPAAPLVGPTVTGP